MGFWDWLKKVLSDDEDQPDKKEETAKEVVIDAEVKTDK